MVVSIYCVFDISEKVFSSAAPLTPPPATARAVPQSVLSGIPQSGSPNFKAVSGLCLSIHLFQDQQSEQ